MNKMSISAMIINDLKETAGLSLREIADILGIEEVTLVNRLKNGKPLSVEDLIQLCSYFDEGHISITKNRWMYENDIQCHIRFMTKSTRQGMCQTYRLEDEKWLKTY